MYSCVVLILKLFKLHLYFSCEIAAGNAIDQLDGIETTGFYIELGTAQVFLLLLYDLLWLICYKDHE